MRYEIALRVCVVLLFCEVWTTLPWDTPHMIAWGMPLAAGIGWLVPFVMERRSGWQFWVICQGCRGFVMMSFLFIAMDMLRVEKGVRDYVDRYASLAFFLFAFCLPREIAMLCASIGARRMVWLEDWVRPMTDGIARVDLARAQKEKPELTVEEHQQAWRNTFFHDSDHTHIFGILVSGGRICINWMTTGHWREGLLAGAITALCIAPFVWQLPRRTGVWAIGLIVASSVLAVSLTAALRPAQAPAPGAEWGLGDDLMLLFCIVLTMKFMQGLASMGVERYLTADELVERVRTWYLPPAERFA